MNKVEDKLFIGDIYSSTNFFNLSANNISHILTVTGGVKPLFPGDFEYLILPVDDTSEADLISYLPTAIEFINQGLEKGTGVLVHWYAGVSRSSSVMIAYIMATYKISYYSAYSKVLDKRPIIKPNQNFIDQLEEFQTQLKIYDYNIQKIK